MLGYIMQTPTAYVIKMILLQLTNGMCCPDIRDVITTLEKYIVLT